MKNNVESAKKDVRRSWLEVRMQFSRLALGIIPIFALSTVGIGCEKSSNKQSFAGGVPSARSMDLLSVTPVEAEEDSLIENGSFENWLVGAPIPRGRFSGPSTSQQRSTLSQTTNASRGSQALLQTWSESDWGRPTTELFSIDVLRLEKDTNYRFSVDVDTRNRGAGYVLIMPRINLRFPDILAELEIEPTQGYKEYSTVFSTGENTEVRIATRGPANPASYPNELYFDNFRLEETEEPVTPKLEVEPSKGLIPNGNIARWETGQVQPGSPFILPKDASEVSRVSIGPDGNPYAIRQRWTDKNNSIWHDDVLFAIQAKVKPNTRYELSVNANSQGKYEAAVDVHGYHNLSHWYIIADGLISVEPTEGWKTYTGRFDSGELENIRITTASFFQTGNGKVNEILWDDWTLTEVGASPAVEVPKPEGSSLITNGSFEVWIPGKPLPEGDFTGPATTSRNSKISPVLETKGHGNASLEQEWTSSDSSDDAENLFGIDFTNLKPETTYKFSCLAYHFMKQPHDLRVFAKQANGTYTSLARMTVSSRGPLHKWEEFSFNFDTRMFTNIRIATQGPAGQAYPYRVLWDNWRLEEVK